MGLNFLSQLLPSSPRPPVSPRGNTPRQIGLADLESCTGPVRQLLHNAAAGGVRLDHIYGSQRPDGRIVAGVLVVPRQGRTGMVFVSHPRGAAEKRALVELLVACRAWLPRERVAMLQAMLTREERDEEIALTGAGFWKLADLAYMQCRVSHEAREPAPPPGVVFEGWSGENAERFIEAMRVSYEATLDCPKLEGLRDVRDVIQGHKASGVFDPGLWTLATVGGDPAAVMLLNPIAAGVVDLVYLGLAPKHRRKKLGTAMMRRAMGQCSHRGQTQMTLAVDVNNEPAMKLYRRFGFYRTGLRTVLLCDLTGNSRTNPAPVDSFSTGCSAP